MATSTVEDYLKEIYPAQQRSRADRIATGTVAAALGVTPGTATSMFKALADAGLVAHEPYAGVRLTPAGYNLRNIGIDKLINFLKNDPEYGGCAVMLGVPNYFRDLNVDCLPDPYLHEVLATADVVMPWTVQRFTPLLHMDAERYAAQVKADIAWSKERGLDYAPCVTPGFSWYNLSKVEFGGVPPLNQIPRQKGKFYWSQISGAMESGAKMLYVAMFDEDG